MSSPSIRKLSSSPILNLQYNSPKRANKLQTILEEDIHVGKSSLLGGKRLLQRQNTNLNLQNRALNDKIRNYAQQTTRYLVQNSRLRQENEMLASKSYSSNIVEVQRLNHEILLKNAQTQKLRSDVQLLKANYDRNLQRFSIQNQHLKNQLVALEDSKYIEAEQIKQKYAALAQQDMNLARKGYYDDVARLSNNLQATKALLSQKQLEIKHLTAHGQNLVREHSIYLDQLVSQNNVLRNQILQIEIKKDNEVKQAQAKKQLQKSRTHGIITFCKENTTFMEKQISKLAEQLLEKSISIEQFTKDMIKIRRNLQQTEKRYQDRIYKIQTDCDERIREMQKQMQKLEKYHKEQLADAKKRQMELQQIISTKQHQYETLERQNKHHKQIIRSKELEIQNLKANLSRLHEDHAKQISKVMSDSRVKRKSMKNLSEISSLRDLSASSGSHIIKKVQRTNSIHEPPQENESRKLYTVQQQIAASQLVHNEEEDDDVAIKDLVLHYENIIQQLKNNKSLQLSMANETIQKLNQNLRQKQQELLEILERFSPLMQYKLNSNSIESERKQKIQKHYRANIDLLSVLLDKNGIAALPKR